MRRATIALVVTALLWAAGPAWAHVDVIPTEAPAGSTVELEFEVGHGCAGSPVVAVSIRLPQGVTEVAPGDRDGWTYSVERSDGFDVVTWEGGPQGANEHGSFFMTVTLPATEGEVLALPTVQICEEGELAWIELPAEDGAEPAYPAPLLTLTAGSADPTTTQAGSDAEQGGDADPDEGNDTGDAGQTTDTTTSTTSTTSITSTTTTTTTTGGTEATDTTVAAAPATDPPVDLDVAVTMAAAVLALALGVSWFIRRRSAP